jgi:acetylornithine deacetylase/succinyl-diaminopimelate desuccinylase-like protein
MNKDDIKNYVYDQFNKIYLPHFMDYIRIPNLSPAYDKEWQTNGFLKQAALHLANFAKDQGFTNVSILEKNTPLIYIYIPASSENIQECVLLYGHYDKQPWGPGWDKDKSPIIPVLENGRLYGRGSADDGYTMYAFLLAIKTIKKLNGSHPKFHIIVEGCEESGSFDINEYLTLLEVFLY